jgi:hypothetical protein
MIKNYEEKFNYHFYRQKGYCVCCEGYLLSCFKIDLCHKLSRTKKNIKNYPLFIDSLLNTFIAHNECNVARLQPLDKHGKRTKQINYHQAEMAERFLERHPKISDFVNGVNL